MHKILIPTKSKFSNALLMQKVLMAAQPARFQMAAMWHKAVNYSKNEASLWRFGQH